MLYNCRWDNPKIVFHLPIGRHVEMLDFVLKQFVKNAGLPMEDYDIFMVCWKTSDEVYDYVRKNNLKFVDMEYDEDEDFLWNLVKSFNLGFNTGFQHAEYVGILNTDYAFCRDWCKNALGWAKPNRLLFTKTIEPGILRSTETKMDFGPTLASQFKEQEFQRFCVSILRHELVTDEKKYGREFSGAAYIFAKDVWERFGPMERGGGEGDLFNKCKQGGAEVGVALDVITYHYQHFEQRRNKTFVPESNAARKIRGLKARIYHTINGLLHGREK